MKTCSDCGQIKSLSEFTPKRNTYEPRCKTCRSIKYNKATLRVAIKKVYNSQKSRSLKKGFPPPAYTLDQLIDWVKQQPNASSLWNNYIASGYSKDACLSIDRIDNSLPYIFSNIQLMTWAENRQKFADDRKLGRATVTERSVMALNLDGTLHKKYHSIMDAVRDVKGRMWGVASVANGVLVKHHNGSLYLPKTYKGFIWKWI